MLLDVLFQRLRRRVLLGAELFANFPVVLDDKTADSVEDLIKYHVQSWEEFRQQINLWFQQDVVNLRFANSDSMDNEQREAAIDEAWRLFVDQLRPSIRAGKFVELATFPFRTLS